MYWRTRLIVITLIRSVATFSFSCVGNYLAGETQGVTIYVGSGGNKAAIFDELSKHRFGSSWILLDEHFVYSNGVVEIPNNYLIITGGNNSELAASQAVRVLSFDVNLWNPGARMIVAIEPTTEIIRTAQSVVSRIITDLWNHMVYDSVVIFTSGEEISHIFTANPFDDGNDCGVQAKVLQNLTCSPTHSQGNIWHHPKVYPNCSFRVSRRESPPFSFNLTRNFYVKVFTAGVWHGTDIEFIRLLQKKKKLHVIWSERPSPETNDTEEHVHQYYINFSRHGIDLAIGGTVMLSKYMYQVAYLRPYDQHRLLYYVADSAQMRGWPILHIMFKIHTWITLGITVLIAGFVYSMLKEGKFSIRHTTFLTVYAILVTQTIALPKRLRLRLFLVALMLPLYHISSLHLTALQSFMVHTPLNKPITLESELIEANTTVFIADANRFFVQEKRNYGNFRTYPMKLRKILKLVENDENVAILARSLEANYLINMNQLRFHQLRDGIAVLPVCMAMSKGSVYFTSVDNLVQQCLEVGLFAKWMNDLTVLMKHKQSSTITAGRSALDMIDLECAFLLLLAGYLAAIIAFLGEKLYYRWEQELQRRLDRTLEKKWDWELKFKL